MKRTWTSEELLEHFTLLPDELAAVGNKSGATRLGFAVLLKCLQYEGSFLHSRQEAAPEVVRFLATQVGVDAALFAQYTWEGRTIEAHRAQIREITKIREFRRADEEALLDWLVTSILPHEQHPERLRELIRTECRTRGVEVPNDIATLIETSLQAYEGQIYTTIAARLTQEMQECLDALLVAAPKASGEVEEELPLSLLRLDPGPVGVESALSEIAKLRSLRAIGLPPDLFAGYACAGYLGHLFRKSETCASTIALVSHITITKRCTCQENGEQASQHVMDIHEDSSATTQQDDVCSSSVERKQDEERTNALSP